MKGDERKLRLLQEAFQEHREKAWRLAVAVTGNVSDAEDTLQQTLLTLVSRSYAIPAEVSWTWLATVIANTGRNVVRTRNRWWNRKRRLSEMKRSFGPRSERPDVIVQDRELADRVLRALYELPRSLREAVCLTHVAGLSQSEAAKELGIPIGTLKSRSRRGLAKLRAQFSDLQPQRDLHADKQSVVNVLVFVPVGVTSEKVSQWFADAAVDASVSALPSDSQTSNLGALFMPKSVAAVCGVVVVLLLGALAFALGSEESSQIGGETLNEASRETVVQTSRHENGETKSRDASIQDEKIETPEEAALQSLEAEENGHQTDTEDSVVDAGIRANDANRTEEIGNTPDDSGSPSTITTSNFQITLTPALKSAMTATHHTKNKVALKSDARNTEDGYRSLSLERYPIQLPYKGPAHYRARWKGITAWFESGPVQIGIERRGPIVCKPVYDGDRKLSGWESSLDCVFLSTKSAYRMQFHGKYLHHADALNALDEAEFVAKSFQLLVDSPHDADFPFTHQLLEGYRVGTSGSSTLTQTRGNTRFHACTGTFAESDHANRRFVIDEPKDAADAVAAFRKFFGASDDSPLSKSGLKVTGIEDRVVNGQAVKYVRADYTSRVRARVVSTSRVHKRSDQEPNDVDLIFEFYAAERDGEVVMIGALYTKEDERSADEAFRKYMTGLKWKGS